MSVFAILGFALLIDAALGEPRWIWDRVPHPAVLMGKVIAVGDQRLNHGQFRRVHGIFLMVLLGLLGLGIGVVLQTFGSVVEMIIVAILLAHRSLVDHVNAVANALRLSLYDGQKSVGLIVGRDTTDMTKPDVARAAVESAAENFSDGVIAPAFWFLVGGLPGLLIYKFTNTADSMIGYRNERYKAFGWAAARFDDLLNLIPARLTALLLAVVLGQTKAWSAIRADAHLHRSPNAGWPEAAMARGLDISLSGPRSYDGQMREFPFVHSSGKKKIGPSEIEAACNALWKAWGCGLAIVMGMALLS